MPGPGADLAMVGPADRLWPSFLAVSDQTIRLASVAAAGPVPSGMESMKPGMFSERLPPS